MSAQETYTKLLETALDLIWHSNYNSVGINDICKQAGVTKGGFYHHFDSKATLFCKATNYYWESVKKELDMLLSPANTPLEQLENIINFIFSRKFGDDPNNIPGCPFFSAGTQTGCEESSINESLQVMSDNNMKYCLALVRNLAGGGYLEDGTDIDSSARLMTQYIQGAVAYARMTRDLATAKRDLPAALYRVLGLKKEFWFKTKATWSESSCCLKAG